MNLKKKENPTHPNKSFWSHLFKERGVGENKFCGGFSLHGGGGIEIGSVSW